MATARGGQGARGGAEKRVGLTIRFPESHRRLYGQLAEAGGYASLGDYIVATLADAHQENGLSVPEYVTRELRPPTPVPSLFDAYGAA